jgi:hypothetical protein
VPVTLKCTAFFGSDEGRGWSESHCLSQPDPPANLLFYMQQFKVLLDDKRRPLLGKDCRLEGLRVSYETAAGEIASSPFKYTPFAYPGNQRAGAAPSVSAKVRMSEAGNTYFSDIHLRGFWDDVEKDEQLDFTTAAGTAWKNLLDQFTAALVAQNYGWEGIDPTLTRRGNVIGYTVGDDKRITFNLAITQGPPLPGEAGTKLRIRCAKINNSNSVLNREFTVVVDTESSVTTVQQVAALPFDSAGTFVIEERQFYQYTGVQYTILGKRSMGRPIGRSRARSKARPLG